MIAIKGTQLGERQGMIAIKKIKREDVRREEKTNDYVKEVFVEDRDRNDKVEIWEKRKDGNEKTNGRNGKNG